MSQEGDPIMKAIIFFALALIASNAGAQDLCAEAESQKHVEMGVRNKDKDTPMFDRILCRKGYVAAYNDYFKAPVWVAYHITKSSVEGGVGRTSDFEPDLEVPEQFRASLADFKYSGYDRGHMAPSATMDFDEESRDESYLLSNMTAQLAGFNQEGWRYLEELVRDLARENGEAYVVTGALFDGVNKTIGEGVHVPSDLYKVIYLPMDASDQSDDLMMGFLIPNEAFKASQIESFQKRVKRIETVSNTDFFHKLRNNLEKPLENLRPDYCSLVGNLEPEACN